jgi:hypothetical protein
MGIGSLQGLYLQRTAKEEEDEDTNTCLSRMLFETTIPVFEW